MRIPRLLALGPLVLVSLLMACSDDSPATARRLLAEGDSMAHGHLVILGGGDRPAAVVDTIVALAGGKGSKIVVVPFASADPVAVGREQQNQFRSYGAARTEVVFARKDSVDAPANLALFDGATGVFFSGGDQNRLADFLRGTQMLARIRQIYHAGGVVAGTSAGAAAMSRLMITGSAHDPAQSANLSGRIAAHHVATTEGFGFLDGVVIDQHFVQRSRQNRLLSLVLEHPGLLGIGIDEGTAIVVGPGQETFRVLGNGPVVVLDAAEAEGITTDARGTFGASDVRLHVLYAGQSFDLAERRVVR